MRRDVIKKGDGASKCRKCEKMTRKSELVTEFRRCCSYELNHFECFITRCKLPLDLEAEFEMSTKLTEANIAEVKERIDTWNRQFQVVVPKKYLGSAVETRSPPARRTLIEVFAYLTSTEIEQLAAFTCKGWLNVTRDEELWRRIYLARFPQPESHSSYRELTILRRLESCWRCRKQLALTEVKAICPVRGRWLCKECCDNGNCEIEVYKEWCNRWKVSSKLVKALQIPTFQYEGAKSIYICEALTSTIQDNYGPKVLAKVLKIIGDEPSESIYCYYYEKDLQPLYEFYGLLAGDKRSQERAKKLVQQLVDLSS